MKTWTIEKLIRELCKRESKKAQVNIAQMREIVGVISDVIYESGIEYDETRDCVQWHDMFETLGAKRAKKK